MGNTHCLFLDMKCSHTVKATLDFIDSQNGWVTMVTISLNSLSTKDLSLETVTPEMSG